jgi:hypothetical protein
MPFEFNVDTSRNLVIVRAAGVITERAAIDIIDDIVQSTGGGAVHMNVLYVLDDHASLSEIDSAVMTNLKAHITRWLKTYPRSGIKCALVSSNPTNLAVGELWRAMTEADPAMAMQAQSFATEALAWLSA